MAKTQYVGVSGVARKVTKNYVGVSGVARNVKSAYVGVEGVARQYLQSSVTWYKYHCRASGHYVERSTPPSSTGTSSETNNMFSDYTFKPGTGYSGAGSVSFRTDDGGGLSASEIVGLYPAPVRTERNGGPGISYAVSHAMRQVTEVDSITDNGNSITVKYKWKYVAYADYKITSYRKDESYGGLLGEFIVSDGELPEEGTLVDGSLDGSYFVLKIGGFFYYYENSIVAKSAGLTQIGEDFYFVDESGEFLKSTVKYISADNEYGLAEGRYLFGEDGKMIRGNGLAKVGEDYYYIKNDGTIFVGKISISAEKMNGYEFVPGDYTFGEDGKMIM